MVTAEKPPATASRWSQMAKIQGLEVDSLYDLENVKSGSKIEEGQYLSLHILWKQHDAGLFIPSDWGINRTQAREYLNRNKSWNQYLKSITGGLKGNPELGTFDMLREYQRVVDGIKKTGPGLDKISMPISSRTRAALKRQQEPSPTKAKGGDRNQGANTPSTPTRSMQQMTQAVEELNLEESEEFRTPSPQPAPTPFSAAQRGEDGEFVQFPPVDDEQIVNTALILLLQGICLRAPGIENAEWTLQRKSFDFLKHIVDQQHEETTEKLFQARTDGHLRIQLESGARSLMILEVKASKREDSKPMMQEGAQMAAWIYAEPDVRNESEEYQYQYV
ncbi:hypothetical protein FQN54_002581 [Arachnomyces sp. PD_36]|nr:hypothetical protein FQN54_002581 [Arachnomyces sp. PD_36]